MDPDADDRQGLLRFPHMVPLENWRNTVAQGRPVPHFDPRDGGIDARLFILLETPGPGDAPVRFVSRDNPGGTQRNLARFLDGAGITRTDMLLWNCVPWIVHAPGARGRPLRRAEIREGLATLPGLLALLPRLTTVVLAGRVAREAAPVIAVARPNVALFTMPHPSPANVCTSPAVPAAIRDTLSAAAARLGSMYKEGGFA